MLQAWNNCIMKLSIKNIYSILTVLYNKIKLFYLTLRHGNIYTNVIDSLEVLMYTQAHIRKQALEKQGYILEKETIKNNETTEKYVLKNNNNEITSELTFTYK